MTLAGVVGPNDRFMYNKSTLEDLIQKDREKESCKNVKILVGGYPFVQSPGLWEKIGADGFAKDASEAVEKAAALVSQDPARGEKARRKATEENGSGESETRGNGESNPPTRAKPGENITAN